MAQVIVQPGATTVVTQSPANEEPAGFITLPSADQLFMCCACCCSKTSLYYKFPDCIGCTSLNECLCCKEATKCNLQCDHLSCCTSSPECFCFDFKKDMQKDGCCACRSYDICYICCLSQTEQSCKIPQTCCKGGNQVLCCDERCALPCDKEVPFQIGCLGLFCVGKPQKQTSTVTVVNTAPPQQVAMVQQPYMVQTVVMQPGVAVAQPAPSVDMER
jgi:hypothetical protein